MALTINGTAMQALPTAFSAATATAGIYHSTNSGLGNSFHAYAPVYEETDITFPGIDGTITKRYGFRYRLLTCSVIIVGNYSSIGATRDALYESWAQQNRYTISSPDGSTFDGCKLVGVNSQTHVNASGKALIVANATFRQLQLNSSGS